MKKILLFSAFFVVAMTAFSQRNDTIAPQTYNTNVGYFQKAFSDESNPRFMVTDSNDNFSFGVGGLVSFVGYYDIVGAVMSRDFSIYKIPTPTDYSGHFGFSASSSRLNFKVVGQLLGRPLVSFLEINVNNSDQMKIRHAYLSYGGLTIGHTYSIFMDLDNGIMTVDLEGPNTSITKRHPLIAYTLPVGRHWTLAASVEKPSFCQFDDDKFIEIDVSENEKKYLMNDFQQLPDFAFHAKYKGKIGNFQIAALLRNMYYYMDSIPDAVEFEGKTRSCFGYGLALSGSVKITKNLLFSGQIMGGRGISEYVANINDNGLDLLVEYDKKTGKVKNYNSPLIATPIVGGYVGVQYNFSKKFVASAVVGDIFILKDDEVTYNNNFKSGVYAAGNLFYIVDKYLRFGLEYLYGTKHINYNDSDIYGEAQRIDFAVKYTF